MKKSINLYKVYLEISLLLFFVSTQAMNHEIIEEKETAQILIELRRDALKFIANMCPKCDKSFTTKSNLTKHLKTHLNIRRFKCSKCSLRFKEKHHLHSHFTSQHTNKRPFKCDICEYKSADRSNLLRHTKTHLKD